MATLWEFRDHHWLGSGTLEEMMLFYGTFSHILPMIQEVSCMSLDHPFSYVTWSSFLILYPFLEWQGYDCKICRTAANAGGPCYATWGRRNKGNWKPCSFWANGLAPKQQNNGGLLSPKRDLNIQIYASTSRCYGVTCFFWPQMDHRQDLWLADNGTPVSNLLFMVFGFFLAGTENKWDCEVHHWGPDHGRNVCLERPCD